MDYLQTLEKLQALHAASGDEKPLATALLELATPYCDTCMIDTLGNVIARREGGGPKRLLTAQMDVPGLVVTHVEESGVLRVGKLGGLSLKEALYRPFRFKSGLMGLLCPEKEQTDQKEPRITELFLDIGAKDRAAAEALVQVGDTAQAVLPNVQLGGRLATAQMNLLCCLALLDAMERSKGHGGDLTFVFAAQGSLGQRGIKTAAFSVMPDLALTIAPAPAATPEEKYPQSVRLSAGAALKVMDNTVVSHPELLEQLEALAVERKIPCQREVQSGGGSAGGVLQLSGPGVRTAGIGIPCRYAGTLAETADLEDVSACAALLSAFCETE